MNPVLPRNHFVPDGEAHVMPDGRLYVYGSYDLSGNDGYCSSVLHVFSTDDLVNWTDHGVAFRAEDVPWASEGSMLYAPDCIHRDGRYYLYFCMNGNNEGVAVADCPWGPFTDPTPIAGADGDSIDPAVFVDDDGQAYYFWGQFHLRGGRLNRDMKTLDMSSVSRCVIDEKRHGFHEGASMRKRGGTYYLTYTDITRGRATCISYAYSASALGPFTYGGVIVDNIGCDPKTWNNHGSIEEFRGKWYIFYHRSSQNSRFSRRLCIEPIEFDGTGRIGEVLPTTQGAEPPVSVRSIISAADACRMGGCGGVVYAAPDAKRPGCEALVVERGNGWALWRYVDFDAPAAQAVVTMESETGGTLSLWADQEKLGSICVGPTDGRRSEVRTDILSTSGVHTLYLEWEAEGDGGTVIEKIRFETSARDQ